MLKHVHFKTPRGEMMAIANHQTLFLLEFMNRKNLSANIARLLHQKNTTLTPGTTPPLLSIQRELDAYFKGILQTFQTPITTPGTPFQRQVWDALQTIPFGQTKSYLEQAKMLAQPNAVRAVANANGQNQFVIRIPCHRVIRHNNTLGGYAAGLEQKAWLIQHEQHIIRAS